MPEKAREMGANTMTLIEFSIWLLAPLAWSAILIIVFLTTALSRVGLITLAIAYLLGSGVAPLLIGLRLLDSTDSTDGVSLIVLALGLRCFELLGGRLVPAFAAKWHGATH